MRLSSFPSASLLSAADFFAGGSVAWQTGEGRLIRQQIVEGACLFAWSGNLVQPLEKNVLDDSGYIHFSYWLAGGARCRLDGLKENEIEVLARTGCIGFVPGRQLRFAQKRSFANLMLLVTPEVLAPWGDMADRTLQREIGTHFAFRNGYRSAELHTTAHALFAALRDSEVAPRHPLWIQAKSMELAALFLEGGEAPATIPASERRRLLLARDRLLADLANPPTIAELARESGLNALKLKRGFKQMFGIGVFGLFQRERMHEAWRRLQEGSATVSTVAADLGYTNASHFAGAFRKQFGVAPREIRKK